MVGRLGIYEFSGFRRYIRAKISPQLFLDLIFYRNQYHVNYKLDEKAIRHIIKNHIFQINVKLNLVIYYKSHKISEKLMKNNLSLEPSSKNEKSHLIYRFTCNQGECMSLLSKNDYIGMTTTTLKERINKHRYDGAIFDHFIDEHGCDRQQRPVLENLLDCTEILYHENDPDLLHIYEALHIKKLKSQLNNVRDDFRCLGLNFM